MPRRFQPKSVRFLSSIAIAIGFAAPAFGGHTGGISTNPDADTSIGDQSWFGPPYIRFGRQGSDTMLPGYAVGTASYTHRFSGDFDSLPGDVSSDEFSFWTPVAGFNWGEYHLFAWLGYGAIQYDTSIPNLLTDHTLQSLSMPVIFIDDVSDRWLWGFMVMPTYAGTRSSSDNFAVSFAAGAGYSVNRDLELFGGVYYYHGFGSDLVIPGAAFIWRPAPRWEAYLLPPLGGVSYSVNEDLMLSVYGQYDAPDWHVKNDWQGPDRDISMSGLRLGVKAEYHIHGLAWAYVAAGYTVFQKLDIEFPDSGVSMQKSDVDPAPYVQVGLNARF